MNSEQSESPPEMSLEDIKLRLRANALQAHQVAVGRGDKLVQLLERAVHKMEQTQNRLLILNTVFFAFGLIALGAGIYMALLGGAGKQAWGVLLGGVGGLASAVSIFYTAPLDKIAQSIKDLIQLETAFLGYIRMIGEVDSAFQWQYIELMDTRQVGALSDVTRDTVQAVQEMMSHTMELVDRYTGGEAGALDELRGQLKAIRQELEARIKALEEKAGGD